MSKLSKKSDHRTLLSVGKDGTVRQVGWLKGLFVFCLLLLAASAGTAGFFYYLHQGALAEVRLLRIALSESENLVRSLTKENKEFKDSQSKSGNHQGSKTKKAAKGKTESPVETPAPAEIPVLADNATTEDVTPEENQGGDNPETTNVNKTTSPPTVDADDLQVKRYKNSLRIEFNLKNVSPDSVPISGHAVAVLKTNGNSKYWLAMPDDVNLVSGRPDTSTRGERFRISRFKTIDLTAKYRRDPELFTVATVFIFNGENELILEKDFPISIE